MEQKWEWRPEPAIHPHKRPRWIYLGTTAGRVGTVGKRDESCPLAARRTIMDEHLVKLILDYMLLFAHIVILIFSYRIHLR